MLGLDVIIAGGGLVLAVGIGLVAHEWSHAFVLRLARIEYTISYAPTRSDGVIDLLLACPWAAVQPRPTRESPIWVLRVAALAPLLLAVPVFAIGAIGPIESSFATAISIGWLACALPSPQDFSVVFYAHRVIDDADETNAAAVASRAD
ncbi:hypothetical protein ACLI4Z_13710 [Natrialbaceae archaeon A-arb3/5]